MGEVYRARDTRLGRDVAVKVLPHHLARDPDSLVRFEREARAVAALAHPNILDVHDFGNEAGTLFLVTELLEGETLRQRLGGVPLPWRKAVEIGLAVAEGLASAHAHGIVHRDLKPDNIFLTFDGRVKILDFGLARLEPEPIPENSPTIPTPTGTKTGVVMGTAGYMSPEQARGKRADARSDIFSLGCVLYEMVTGRRAFSGESMAETLVQVLKEEPADPRDLVKDLPEDVNLVILRCLSKYPESRFESARDLAFALRVAGTESLRRPVEKPAVRRLPRPIYLLAGAAVVIALVALGVPAWLQRGGGGPIDSLAVLPFTNASKDPDAEYLSDGITESVINSLLQLPQLRVLPRTLVFPYKGEKDPLKAGRKLKVRGVLTGEVSRQGDNLLVQAELTDVNRGSQLWGKRFQEDFSDAFAVQERIAQEILKSLRVNLSGEEEQRFGKRDTQDAEAYDLYLKGRLYWNKRTADSILKGIEFFEKSIERDPNYALPYAGLSDSFVLLAFYGWRPPKELLPKARQNAIRALQIDGTIAEAHVTLADTSYLFDRDWETAEREFRQGIALSPDYSTGHQWFANYLIVSGRPEEAVREILRAQKLDPLDLIINTDVGLIYYYAGEKQKAIEHFHKTLELEPNFFLTHVYLALVHLQGGSLQEAIEEAQTATRLAPDDPDALALLGHAYGVAGRKREAEAKLEEIQKLSKERFVSAFPVAFIYLGLGQRDKAFQWLEKAYEERAPRLVYLGIEHAFDPLRADPRFQDLLERLGIPARPPNTRSPSTPGS